MLSGARESIHVQLVPAQSQEKHKFLQSMKMVSCDGEGRKKYWKKRQRIAVQAGMGEQKGAGICPVILKESHSLEVWLYDYINTLLGVLFFAINCDLSSFPDFLFF